FASIRVIGGQQFLLRQRLRLGTIATTPASLGEDCQKRYFDGEGFVNVAPQMIAQFFETSDPSYNFSAAEARCECSGFCSSMRQITMHHTVARPKNISPPGEQCLNQSRAPLQVKTFGERLVVSFSFFQPRAVSRILVTRLFLFQRLIGFALHFLTHFAEQALKSLGKPIGELDRPFSFAGGVLQ